MKRLLPFLLMFGVLPSYAQADPEIVQIVFIGASDGIFAIADDYAFSAAEFAASELAEEEDSIEAADGTRYVINVERVRVSSADTAIEAYQDAVDRNASAILASTSPSIQDALLAQTTLTIPILYTAVDNENPPGALKVSPDLQAYINATANYLTAERGLDSIAIMNADTVDADEGADAFERTIGTNAVAVRLEHAADEVDFMSDAREIRESGADAVFIWTLDTPGKALLRAFDEVGWNGLVVYFGLDEEFTSGIDIALIDGLLTPASWLFAAANTATREFLGAIDLDRDEIQTADSGAYYDMIALIADSLRRTESVSRVSLGGANIDGVLGAYVNGRPTTVLLFETDARHGYPDWTEAARYVGNTCLTCPDFFVNDTSDISESREALFTIALLADQTSVTSETGRHAQQAIELAMREINESGGIIGPQNVRYSLRLAVYDTPDPTSAPAAFQRAVSEGANVILGPDLNSGVVPTALAADIVGIPQISTATGLTSSSLDTVEYLKQGRSNDRTRARAAVTFVTEDREIDDIALIVARTDWGLNVQYAVRDAISATDDAELVLSVEHGTEQPDLATFLPQIEASGAEAVLVWSTPASLMTLLDAMNTAGWEGTVVYGYAVPELLQPFSAPASRDIDLLVTVGWWPTARDWPGKTFAQSYRELFDEEPFEQTAAYYDAVHLVRRGIQAVGPAPAALRTYLSDDAAFIGAQGLYAPGDYETGELTQAVQILSVSDELGVYSAEKYSACPALCVRAD